MQCSEAGILAESFATSGTPGALNALAGLAVKLLPLDPALGVPQGPTGAVPLCRLILQHRKGVAACRGFLAGLQAQLEFVLRSGTAGTNPAPPATRGTRPRPARALRSPPAAVCTPQCFAGLTKLAVPVTVQGKPVAALLCGEFFTRKPAEADFNRCLRHLRALGIRLDRARARSAYFQTPVIRPAHLAAARQVLGGWAQHLARMADTGHSRPRRREPACVARARQLVVGNLEAIPTTRCAAREAHVTEPYFCRVFRTATGMTFSEYVARCHVELAREILHNPNFRVTDVAYAAGFQSIPHFNHTFKRYTGLSPSGYRASLRQP